MSAHVIPVLRHRGGDWWYSAMERVWFLIAHLASENQTLGTQKDDQWIPPLSVRAQQVPTPMFHSPFFDLALVAQLHRPNTSPVVERCVYEEELGEVEYTTHADGSVTVEKQRLREHVVASGGNEPKRVSLRPWYIKPE